MVLNLDPLVTSLRPGHVESNYLHMSTNIDTPGSILRPVYQVNGRGGTKNSKHFLQATPDTRILCISIQE